MPPRMTGRAPERASPARMDALARGRLSGAGAVAASVGAIRGRCV